MRTWRWVVALLLLPTLAGCVGPSLTDADYRNKVANTAQSAASALRTAELAVRVAAEGRAPDRYTSGVFSEMETTVTSISTGFGSVQPPSAEVITLRSEVMTLLDQSSTVLGDLRIAARMGDVDALPAIAAPLPELARRFTELRAVGVP